MNVVLLLLNICMIMHLSIFYVLIILCMFMFMGLVAQMFNDMGASSSPVGWSGTLHYGIRADVTSWA